MSIRGICGPANLFDGGIPGPLEGAPPPSGGLEPGEPIGELNDLTDVTITPPINIDQGLYWSGSAWTNQPHKALTNNPHEVTAEQVDAYTKAVIDSSQSAQDLLITQNSDAIVVINNRLDGIDTDYSALEARVTINEGDISTNASGIATLDGRVDAHDTSIAQNAGDITILDGRVDAHDTSIAANTGNIATNAADIDALETGDTVQDGLIAANTAAIGVLDGRVDAHDTSISTNTGNIATNVTDISQNTGDISTLDTRVDGHDTSIAANASDIDTLESSQSAQDILIAANASDVDALETSQGVQDGLIAGNASDISTIQSEQTTQDGLIAQNTTDIGTNTADIVTLDGRVDGHDTDISAIQAEQITQNADIAQNTSDIANHAHDVDDLTTTTGNPTELVRVAAAGGLEYRTPAEALVDLGAEPDLGAPSAENQMLISTVAKVRSWVSPVLTTDPNTWTALQTFTKGITIDLDTPTDEGLVIQGALNQADDHLNVQLHDGTPIAGIDERGVLFANAGTSITNVFIGDNTGNKDATGSGNVGLGAYTMVSLADGNRNLSIGRGAGSNITDGDDNMAIGTNSGFNITTGNDNVLIGANSGFNLKQGQLNLFMGESAGYSATLGQKNVYLGAKAGYKGTSASENVKIGYGAGYWNTGTGNVFIGFEAAENTFNSADNTLVIHNGDTATPLIYGEFDTTLVKVNGDLEVLGVTTIDPASPADVGLVIKGDELQTNNILRIQLGESTVTSGFDSRGILFSNGGTTSSNTFAGRLAGNTTSTGYNNLGMGAYALSVVATGYGNMAMGTGAGIALTDGNNNMMIGTYTGYSLTDGDENCLVGQGAGLSLSTGSGNVFIGNRAAATQETTGSNKLYIHNSDTATPLLYGEFDNGLLQVNGDLEVQGSIKVVDGSEAADDIMVSDANGLGTWKTPTIAVPVALTTYDPAPNRGSVSDIHGGIMSLATAQPLDSTPTNIVVSKGIGKVLIVINAGSDLVGDITLTGTTVNRETGATTPADTDTVTVDALTTDSSDTDGNGNNRYSFSGAYISSKWFQGSVTISTSDLTLTDVDVYHVSFEQFNDEADYTIRTFDANILTTHANAEFDAYLYSLVVSGDKCTIAREASLNVGTDGSTAIANMYERLRRGNIDKAMSGSSDGIWVEVFYSNSPAYVEDVTVKVWSDVSRPLMFT